MNSDPRQQFSTAVAASLPAPSAPRTDRLGDFTTDSRLLIITPMAAVVGVISAFVAVALVWLIGSLTNLFYYHRFASGLVSDEMLEEAVDKMIGHGVGRLPVVEREHPTRLLGYLGRKGIADAWEDLREEDQVREAGWITSRTRLLRRKVSRVLSDSK